MRAQGARVGIGELLSAHRALAAVDCSSREEARLALRAALCSGREDLERFERAFVTLFGAPQVLSGRDPLKDLGRIERAALPRVGVPDAAPPAAAGQPMPVPVAWSSIELLRSKDFGKYTEAETVLARELIAQLASRGPTRLSRRTRPSSRRRGHAPDLRRLVRASLR